MPATPQFAVLQRDGGCPGAEQIRRAFRSFSTLTDADAVRLAANAQGILLRHLSSDQARAFLRALQAEGVAAAMVSENELRLLPESRALHRLSLTDRALEVYDLQGRPKPVAWSEIALVAAGAVRHVEIGAVTPERATTSSPSRFGIWPKRAVESVRKVESEVQLVLEILLAGGAIRYELDAAQFPFKYAVDRPEFSTVQKFVWLVREIGLRATRALLNRGASDVRHGIELVRGYPTRQAFTDEMLWLLWSAASQVRALPGDSGFAAPG
jgi:hypothetical protein